MRFTAFRLSAGLKPGRRPDGGRDACRRITAVDGYTAGSSPENDLPNVREGDTAEIRLNAYPDRVLRGSVSNIGAVLDPAIRTAKVRVEVGNPGIMRLGMFVKATFRARSKETQTVVPASAILHLHDRDWVYVPGPNKAFRRVEVIGGAPCPTINSRLNPA